MKIIFMCPNYHKYGEKIAEKIREYLGHDVLYLSHTPFKYKYKNFLEKLLDNIYYRPIKKKSFKKIKEEEMLITSIENFGHIDVVLVIRPDFYSHEVMRFLRNRSSTMIIHFWDSIKYIKKQKQYLQYFDLKSTFDKCEAEEYEMEFLPNFYFEQEETLNFKENCEYDIFAVMSYDERFYIVEKIAKILKNKNINYKIIVVTKKKIQSEYVNILNEFISLEEVKRLQNLSKTILEIGHTSFEKMQGGLSMRAIEALGSRKKLITTYNIVKEYDFYNEKNIKVLDLDNIEIDKSFFEIPYEELDDAIYKKYSLESWIKRLIRK